MKYYILSVSTEREVIGYYPQISECESYDRGRLDSYPNVSWKERPKINPYYDVKINYKSKVTNLIDTMSGFAGLVVDVKFKKVLCECTLPPHDFFPVNVSHRNKMLEYYWFHFVRNVIDHVDFKQTTFEVIRLAPFHIFETISVSSPEELQLLKRKYGLQKHIRVKKISLLDSFEAHDILSISGIFPTILISERLKNKIEEEGITGCSISLYEPLEV